MNHHQNHPTGQADIRVKELPALHLACILHTGHDHLESTFEKLMTWAGAKGLLDTPDFKLLTIYHDSFKTTDPASIRMSAGILLREPDEPDGEVRLATIDAGRFVTAHFEMASEDFDQAWRDLFVWLNKQGHQAKGSDCFEIYHNDYRLHPEKKFITDLYIPIS